MNASQPTTFSLRELAQFQGPWPFATEGLLPIITASLAIISVGLFATRRKQEEPFSGLQGPPSTSWLYGHIRELFLGEFGCSAEKWIKEYGPNFAVKGCYGEDRVMIADPRTINALIMDAYRWPRAMEHHHLSCMIFGQGLLGAEGQLHKSQRHMLSPGFGVATLKGALPKMLDTAHTLIQEWSTICEHDGYKRITDGEEVHSGTIDIYIWLHRAALDVLGKCHYEHDFRTLLENEDPAARSYYGLFHTFMERNPAAFLTEQATRYMPGFMLRLMPYLPVKAMKMVRTYRSRMKDLARQLLDDTPNDILSIKEEERSLITMLRTWAMSQKQEDYEKTLQAVTDQLITFMFAGTESGAVSVTWTLHHLAMYPEQQDRLRKEINDAFKKIYARGDTDMALEDLETMPHVVAFVKESFRVYAGAPTAIREPTCDISLPITEPVKSKSGEVLREFMVKKGQVVILNIEGYNRSVAAWGSDAKIFDPDRWLDGRTEGKISTGGLYSNLMTFFGGGKGCIGYRFAVLHLQIFTVELIRRFKFELVPDQEIVRELRGGLMPFVKGANDNKARLPMIVTPLEE